MADDIIEIEDYEVKDTQIIETDSEESNNNTDDLISVLESLGYKLSDVKNGKISIEQFVAQLNDEELETITRGGLEGMYSPRGVAGNAGVFGATSDSLLAKGIPSICTNDGPSGIRLLNHSTLLSPDDYNYTFVLGGAPNDKVDTIITENGDYRTEYTGEVRDGKEHGVGIKTLYYQGNWCNYYETVWVDGTMCGYEYAKECLESSGKVIVQDKVKGYGYYRYIYSCRIRFLPAYSEV